MGHPTGRLGVLLLGQHDLCYLSPELGQLILQGADLMNGLLVDTCRSLRL